MILKNDVLKFVVFNKTTRIELATYSKALAFAKTLDFAFVNINASSLSGDSALSASVAKVRAGQVEMIHAKYAIDSAAQFGAV